ncbi:MAG: ATP-binding protein [Flammeovirgaceae bacterium]|nr:ATP-binding protein [Flammeovirgaceae bacterium]
MGFREIRTLIDLKKVIAVGEGIHTEFKRKISDPLSVISEMIALANTKGGHVMIGVDDDRSLVGIKYPEEDIYQIDTLVKAHCKPALDFTTTSIKISEKKSVLILTIEKSNKRPHFLLQGEKKTTFVRSDDMTVKASREMKEILRREKSRKDIRFSWGEFETLLMQYLEDHPYITLNEFQKISGLGRFSVSRKLILLVLANVLKVTPTERGDIYSRVP